MTSKKEAGMLPSADWVSSRWRPMMGWMYMVVCIFDFIIFPILWTLVQVYAPQGSVTAEWSPLTLKGGGLFHMAMGAVLGVAAWSRGQEKITAMNQTANGGFGNSGYNNSGYNNRYYSPTVSDQNTYRQNTVPQPPAPEL
jgi:hypothetical protein